MGARKSKFRNSRTDEKQKGLVVMDERIKVGIVSFISLFMRLFQLTIHIQYVQKCQFFPLNQLTINNLTNQGTFWGYFRTKPKVGGGWIGLDMLIGIVGSIIPDGVASATSNVD